MIMKMKLDGKNYEMRSFKNEKKDLWLLIDFKKKKGLLMDDTSAGHMYDIDIQYNTNKMISKIRLV